MTRGSTLHREVSAGRFVSKLLNFQTFLQKLLTAGEGEL